jgi:hypothetical protein
MSDVGDEADFVVVAKKSAREANETVAALADERGATLSYPDRTTAEECAADLSERGETPVEVQAVAPQDSTDADAYLVAAPERRSRTPDGSVDGTMTFDTTATQYGALGETLLCCYESNPPVLAHYAREDLDHLSDAERDRLHLAVDQSPDPVEKRDANEKQGASETMRWIPDCRAVARLGSDGPALRDYWCEVKTGDGSFERDQRAVMRWKAREATVLKIHFDVQALPDSYSVTVSAVEPADGPLPDDATTTSSGPTRLDEF